VGLVRDIRKINESEDVMQPYGSYPVRKAAQPVAETTHRDYRGLHLKGIKARARRLGKLLAKLGIIEGTKQ